ncbi:carbon-nitrogen hydrolase family protein [Flavihumibacter sp. UBA7668]|uniref:carbon-nitrogen hydrolase family protein n=1 Tax=Flavihumibacter sp. UBA7668 TaxID=1946542 RepID=UPI0025BD4315|nr:carbon-nitrogen hydrolase family protein [Flavihumibacter sp. UBA7668]
MKLAIAQLASVKDDIQSSIYKHINWIQKAKQNEADVIFFPELSITGYEPAIAEKVALNPLDDRLYSFQELADESEIAIGVGLPARINDQVFISLLLFQKRRNARIYSKQLLHEDEIPFFSSGNKQEIYKIKNQQIAPAICYESLQASHAEMAVALGATIYVATVAKSPGGIEKAYKHYPAISSKLSIPVCMVNSVGPADNFIASGKSSVWSANGDLLGSLNSIEQGILIFDTEACSTSQISMNE